MFAKMRTLSIAALLTAAIAAPALAGPPWISIEYPVNPHDQSMRGAMLLVHVFHHSTPIASPMEGTAEGIVNGERRSVKLAFTETSRPGVYGLSRQWGTEGVWTLVIRMSRTEGGTESATAVVELGTDGEIASVRVPTRQEGGWTIPTDVSMTEIDQALRTRAGKRA
ncbi:MAG TPA: hypothetical protein VN908_04485 [Gemmatimonadales bacterium]|nr:hypothetical protein [Gemmatimonadales bacterium]